MSSLNNISPAPGTLIEYYQSKRIMCAICMKADNKDNLSLRSEENREDKIHKNKVLFCDKSPFGPSSEVHSIVDWLKDVSARRQQAADLIALSDLWELLEEEPGDYDLVSLCELNSPGKPTSEQLSVMYRALDSDKTWFVRKGSVYQPRTRVQVEEIQHRLRAEQDRVRDKGVVVKWLKQLWFSSDETVVPLPSDASQAAAVQRHLTWIREVAVHGPEASHYKDVTALLKEVEIQGKDAPFRILNKCGWWTHDEFIALHKHQISEQFKPEIESEAALVNQQLQQELHAALEGARPNDLVTIAGVTRRVLTHLPSLTIDDEDTTEIDDALSIERLDDGYVVGIHIADVAAAVQPLTICDLEARNRVTDVYLPERKFRMLPASLGDDGCSLVAGQPRQAFSFLIRTNSVGEIVSHEMQRTVILVDRRWTYKETDDSIRAESFPLPELLTVASVWRQARQAAGAFTLPFGRANLKVVRPSADSETQQPEIMITPDETDSNAQLIVSEMMIQANRISGETLSSNQIPAIYRGQPKPDIELPTESITPEAAFKLRRHLRKGETGLKAARHSGLGIDAYCQSTSPIRRFGDLLMQRQLCAHLMGQPAPYQAEEMEVLLQEITGPTQTAESLERERKLYWTLRYLEQRRHREFDAIVLANFPDKHIVQLQPIFFETDCPLIPGKPLPPGTRVKVRIENVFPRQESLRVSVVLDD
jgi:exoribonuclease II